MHPFSPTLYHTTLRHLAIAGLLSGLTGCQAAALTSMGIGGSTGINHAMNGIAYRTFSIPTLRVKKATITALGRMQIKVESTRKEDASEIIVAKTSNRNIEIAMESLSPNTTRMRTVAKDGLFYDSATAAEIIFQTEKVLGNS